MSLEKSCEDVELALLAAQADLSDFAFINFDSDSDANCDRIVVKAEPAQVALMAADGVTVRQWMVPVAITIRFRTHDAAGMETAIAAVNAANNDGPAPAAAVTLATSSFSGGPRIENLPEGDRETEDKKRSFTTRFAFYVSP